MPEINCSPRTRPDVTQRALPNPLVQTILHIPHLTTGVPIPCLDLDPLLLPLALLGLEDNTFSLTNPVCHKPLVKTHGAALGISGGRTGEWTITAITFIAGSLGKWNTTGGHMNGTVR